MIPPLQWPRRYGELKPWLLADRDLGSPGVSGRDRHDWEVGRSSQFEVRGHEGRAQVLGDDHVERISDGQVVPETPGFGDQRSHRDSPDRGGEKPIEGHLDPSDVVPLVQLVTRRTATVSAK